jgi:hypothetical protein
MSVTPRRRHPLPATHRADGSRLGRTGRSGDTAADQHLRIVSALHEDRQHKTQQIQALEREIAGRLVQTPYILLPTPAVRAIAIPAPWLTVRRLNTP